MRSPVANCGGCLNTVLSSGNRRDRLALASCCLDTSMRCCYTTHFSWNVPCFQIRNWCNRSYTDRVRGRWWSRCWQSLVRREILRILWEDRCKPMWERQPPRRLLSGSTRCDPQGNLWGAVTMPMASVRRYAIILGTVRITALTTLIVCHAKPPSSTGGRTNLTLAFRGSAAWVNDTRHCRPMVIWREIQSSRARTGMMQSNWARVQVNK